MTTIGITVTKQAWEKMRTIIRRSQNPYGFLFSSKSGGCSGFNYQLGLLNEEIYRSINKQKYKTILTDKDTKLYVDPVSEMYLVGTSIDYIPENYEIGIYESKFTFEPDKEKAMSCGCGISFSPKIG
jgi:iron-sulfur cluster assembly accessory protein